MTHGEVTGGRWVEDVEQVAGGGWGPAAAYASPSLHSTPPPPYRLLRHLAWAKEVDTPSLTIFTHYKV